MQDWIALDGIRSDTLPGLVCMSYTPPLLPKRQQEETLLPLDRGEAAEEFGA